MGTHPIFESDFDCLTERGLLKCVPSGERSASDVLSASEERCERARSKRHLACAVFVLARFSGYSRNVSTAHFIPSSPSISRINEYSQYEKKKKKKKKNKKKINEIPHAIVEIQPFVSGDPHPYTHL